MAKKKKRAKYISKGQRPSVSKDTRKGMKREAKQSVPSWFRSVTQKEDVILRPHAYQNGNTLKDKYQTEKTVMLKAIPLLNKFAVCGLTKAEAIHAVKTDYVEKLSKKWTMKLRKWQEEQKKLNKYRNPNSLGYQQTQ